MTDPQPAAPSEENSTPVAEELGYVPFGPPIVDDSGIPGHDQNWYGPSEPPADATPSEVV